MILTSLLSFFGGGAFRYIFGEFVAWKNKKLEHEQELARMQFQAAEAAAQHARNLESQRLQADLQVKVITVQADAATGLIDAEAWKTVAESTTKQTGIVWVDAWNASIRPACATWAMVMMTLEAFKFVTLSEAAAAIVGGALGLYLADRQMSKRGK